MSPENSTSKPAKVGTSDAAKTLAAMAAEADELTTAAGGPVTEGVARWLAPTYAAAARNRLDGLDDDDRFKALREFIHDLALLRRGDQAAARLQLDRDRLAWDREQAETEIQARFQEWLRDPAVTRRLLEQHLGDQERQRRIREIFNLGDLPSPPDSARQPSPASMRARRENRSSPGSTGFPR